MKAYYFDNIDGDQRLPHDSSRTVTGDQLEKIGVLHWQIPVEGYETNVDKVAKDTGVARLVFGKP